ncbi:MAG: hypothetical protein AAGC63_15345, partial [Propionicimonas sp.]
LLVLARILSVLIVISVLVLAGLVSMFASGLSAHADTKARDAATGTVGVAVNSLQGSIRNSSAFSITGSTLRARVAVGDGTAWECRAWSLAGATLFYKVATSAITIPADYAGYRAAGWADLTNGAKGVSGTLTEASVSNLPFLRSGSRLLYGLRVRIGDAGTAVTLEGASLPQAVGEGSPASCW